MIQRNRDLIRVAAALTAQVVIACGVLGGLYVLGLAVLAVGDFIR